MHFGDDLEARKSGFSGIEAHASDMRPWRAASEARRTHAADLLLEGAALGSSLCASVST
jgi:hypothetical protein